MVSFARAAAASMKLFDQGVGTLAAGAHIAQVGTGRSATGLSINTDKAMKYAAFWSAVRILAESMASLPLNVMRHTIDGADIVRDHPVHRLIHDLANPQMSAYTWREVGMTHVTTWGMAYSLKVRDGTGNVRELWPLAPDRMDPVGRNSVGDLTFRYHRTDGQTADLTASDVFYLPGLSWDGIQGYSIIRNARETIGLGLAAEEHGSRFFSNGATTNFVLGTDSKLSDDSWKHLDSQVKDEHTGLSNAWAPWVLEEGLKPFDLSMPNDDAQWLETRKHQVTDIARWFRIPPHMLADLERATFSNIEHQALEFVKYTLLPWIVRWEQAIGMQLLGDEWTGTGGDLFVKFNVNALERADMKTRFESYAIGRQWGFMNGDQIADLEDWNHFDGGDEYIVPLNMTAV
ncbi:MAG TPA: phage portal protein, partial [Candidatus Limnocylindrales bacterium]|nr:phage portal protein [Candidatus Limnocylindrales bacterium]